MQAVRHGSLRDEDWISLSSTLGPLAASNIYIDDTSGITPSQLRSRCRRLKMEHGLDMIMVDYLQPVLHLFAVDERGRPCRKPPERGQ